MAKTPEGHVKDAVKDALRDFVRRPNTTPMRAWWPVPSGYGESTVDLHIVYKGKHFAVEVKKHKGRTTALQRKFLRDNAQAGGISIVVEGKSSNDIPPRNLCMLLHLLDIAENLSSSPTEVFW